MIRVVIADDHLAVREGVRAMLALEPGIEVIGEAADGASALRLARELRPDLMVLDNSMPGMTGLDVSRTVTAELPNTGIVFLTMDPALRDLALSGGAMAYVLKDAPPEELLRAVRATTAALTTRRRLAGIPAQARRFVELLIATRTLEGEQLDEIMSKRTPDETLPQTVRRLELVPEAELAELLGQASGTPVVSLAPYPEVGRPIAPTEDRIAAKRMLDPIDRAAARMLPLEVTRSLGIAIITVSGDEGVLAMADPLDDAAFGEAERRSGLRLARVTATAPEIAEALERAWSGSSQLAPLAYRIVGAWRTVAVALGAIALPLIGLLLLFREGIEADRIFALFALLCGFFFFAYALKYYITSAAVLAVALFGDTLVLGKTKNGNGNGNGNGHAKAKGNGHGNGNGHSRKQNGNGKEHKEGYKTLRGEKLDEAGSVLADATPIIGEVRLPIHKQPFISVQLALYNEARVVDRLLAACTSFDYENYEVIVVDDSTDATVEHLARWKDHPRVRVIHRSSRKGFKGGALQEALRRMNPRAEYVMIFDADFIPPADAMWHFLDYFGRLGQGKNGNGHHKNGNGRKHANGNGAPTNGERLGAVQGYQWHMLNASENWITKGVRAEFAGSYVLERAGQELFGTMKMISGSVYMIRADVLRKLGWSTSITEDWELTIRMYLAGYKVLYTPYIQAPAECVSTVRRLIRQRMRWAEGHTYNVKKYFLKVLRSPNLTWREKLEFVYYAPYYLQSVVFAFGTVAWLLSDLLLGQRLPSWSAILGWSLVMTNIFALPLMNLAGVLLEGSLKRDAIGLLSFVGLSWLLVPFQAYASVKGLLEHEEGGWVRTPKSGLVTEALGQFKLAKLLPWELPKRKRTRVRRSRMAQIALTCLATLLAIAILGMGAMSVRAAGSTGKPLEVQLIIPTVLGTLVPLALLVAGWVKLRQRMGIAAIALAIAFTVNVVFLAAEVPAEGVTDNTSTFTLARSTSFASPNLDMKQNYTPSGQAIAFKSQTGQTTTATAATSITVNSNYDYGAVQLAWVTWRGAVTITNAGEGPWTLVRSTTDATNTVTSALFIRVVVMNQQTNVKFSSSAAGDATLMVQEYTGVDMQSPTDVESGTGTAACGTPCNLTAPTVTTSQANDMIVTFHSAACGGTAPLWTAPSGETKRYDIATTSTLASLGADATQAAVGASGSKTATVSCGAGSAVGVTETIALRGRSMTCPAIQYRSSTTNSATAATSLVLNVPAGVLNGDVMIATLSTNAGTLATISGWNSLTTSATKATYYRVASNEPASYTFTDGAVSTNWAGVIDAYIGVDTVTLPEVTGTLATGTTAAVSWTSITTSYDQALSIAVSFENNNVDTIAPPALYTPRSAVAGAAYIRTSTRWISPAGAVAPTSTDTNASTSWGAINLALRPGVATASASTLPGGYNYTCKFSSDQMSAGQTMSSGSVLTNLYLDNAPGAKTTGQGATTVLEANGVTTNTAGGAVNTISANKPTGTSNGDIMLAYFAEKGGTGMTDASITVPSGWTRIDRVDNGTNLSLLVYWHLAGSTEPASYAWSWTGTAVKPALVIEAYAGVDTTNPIDGHAGAADSTNSGSYVAPSVTLTYEYETRVAAFFVGSTGGCQPFWYANDATATSSGGGASSNISGNVGHSTPGTTTVTMPDGSSGSTGSLSCALAPAVMHHLALKPAAHTCTVTATLLHSYAPQYRSSQTNVTSAGVTSFSINTPSGAATGDVLIAALAFNGGSTPTITATGWTLVRRTNATGIGLAVYWQALASTPPASYTFTFSTSNFVAGGISAYSNVNTSSPVNVENGTTTTTTTSLTPSIITTQPDDLILSVHSIAANDTWTPPSGMNERYDVKSTSTVVAIEQNDVLQQPAQSISESATAVSTSGNGVNEILALKGKAATTIGSAASINLTAPAAGPALYTNSITVSATENFNLGDRFELDVAVPNDSTNCGVTLWFDSTAYQSQVIMSTIVPEQMAGMMLVAPVFPLGLEWWRRRRRP